MEVRQGHNTLLVKMMMLTEVCLSLPAQWLLSGTADGKDESALSFPPLSLPLSLHLLVLVLCSAVHTATTTSCLFSIQRRARRQELLHHPALERGKTPQRHPAQEIDMKTRVISG